VEKSNTHYWLALKLVPRLAIHKKLALVDSFGLTALFSLSTKTSVLSSSKLTSANNLTPKQLAAFQHPDWCLIEKIIEQSTACDSEIITFDNEYYPKLVKQIYDPPLVLFIQGNKSLLNQTQLAIIGSRSASINGRESAFEFAKELAMQGLVITSGLALGIDAAAHQGTLTIEASTVAVVATGLDKIYPAKHKVLRKNIIAQHGAIISEFLPGTSPKPGHFPKRNRLISGLSAGVLVVEAALKSGSLITARCALEQNRDVFAIPSSIHNLQAKGCHWLIKQGAKLVEEAADILEELGYESSLVINLKPQLKSPANINNDLCGDKFLANVGFEITPVDKVVSRSKLPIEVVLTKLTMLELNGLVTAVPGGYLRVR